MKIKMKISENAFLVKNQKEIHSLFRQKKILPFVYALLAIGICLMAYDDLGTWKATAWAVNYYDFGFVKRGFLGSLIDRSLYSYQGFFTVSLGIGIDFFRWIALALFNVWFVEMLLIIRFNKVPSLLETLYQNRRWLYLSIFASVWMGPIGITSYFPDPWVLIVGD